jgi:hypothetical protein
MRIFLLIYLIYISKNEIERAEAAPSSANDHDKINLIKYLYNDPIINEVLDSDNVINKVNKMLFNLTKKLDRAHLADSELWDDIIVINFYFLRGFGVDSLIFL